MVSHVLPPEPAAKAGSLTRKLTKPFEKAVVEVEKQLSAKAQNLAEKSNFFSVFSLPLIGVTSEEFEGKQLISGARHL